MRKIALEDVNKLKKIADDMNAVYFQNPANAVMLVNIMNTYELLMTTTVRLYENIDILLNR